MSFTREINRLLIGLLVLFAGVAITAAYWSIVGADTILQREDNPRRVEAERAIQRGDLVDRDGVVLAETISGDNGVLRSYPYPATYGALGYYSYRYGASGIEAASNALLSGADLERSPADALVDGLLHRVRIGSDARLTLDLDVQTAVAEALAGRSGAVVVIGVPDGNVLALVSLPTYDPNTLDANWDQLVAAPGNPFFNRVIQGRYQPGGALETPLIAAAMLTDIPLDTLVSTAPITLEDLELSCAVRLPQIELTLREAYAFACPGAFSTLIDPLGARTLEAVFDTFRLNDLPLISGYDAPAAAPSLTPTVPPAPVRITADNALETALGQGRLTVTPLSMALMAAGIVNDGNAPQPYLLLQTRAPNGEWVDAWTPRPSLPITTTNTARRLQDLMRSAVAFGAAQNAGRPGIDIGGHAAVAYSGEGSLVWFVGFATFGGEQGAAVAVIVEDSADPGLAADIGGTALAAAQAAVTAGGSR